MKLKFQNFYSLHTLTLKSNQELFPAFRTRYFIVSSSGGCAAATGNNKMSSDNCSIRAMMERYYLKSAQ
jgi:hypothetical protein